jgi:TIR domain
MEALTASNGPAMADVFISYAKADRPLASKLAAMLEAEGWKVLVGHESHHRG